jgi:predicted NBD/HSP70 family sugar kinase
MFASKPNLKGINSCNILLSLKENGSLSKRDLGDLCNLSRPTVDKIISELLKRGIVCKDGHKESSGGRRPLLYKFNEQAKYAVGVDLEIPQLEIVLCDLNGKPIFVKAFNLKKDEPKWVIGFVRDKIMLFEKKKIIGIGLGAPAFLKGDTITICGRNLPKWDKVPVKAMLEDLLGVPIFVDNDANFMALAENHHMGYDDHVLVYVALRRGTKGDIRMGGSVLIEGKVLHGAHGNAVSLQHAYVEPEEGLERTSLKKLREHLIVQVVNLVTLFDPSRVVINAEILGEYESLFISYCKEALKELRGFEEVEVVAAQDKKFTCAKGAALFVLQDLFSRPERLVERLTC